MKRSRTDQPGTDPTPACMHYFHKRLHNIQTTRRIEQNMCCIWRLVRPHQLTHYSPTPCSLYITIFYLCFLFWSNAPVRGSDRWPLGEGGGGGLYGGGVLSLCISHATNHEVTGKNYRRLERFLPKSPSDGLLVQKACLLFLPLITLSYNKNNVSPLKLLGLIGSRCGFGGSAHDGTF